jgi:transcriptional regulator with XRE-family HTH domain
MHATRDGGKAVLAHLGKEVRRRRQKLGLSQAALAAEAGIHANVVGRVERGTYNPSLLTLHAIAGALNTSIVHLMRDDPTRR